MGQTHLSLYPGPQERLPYPKEEENQVQSTQEQSEMEKWKYGVWCPLNTPLGKLLQAVAFTLFLSGRTNPCSLKILF